MQNKIKPITTSELLDFFPEVELPIVFSDETLAIFNKENRPLPNLIIQTVFEDFEGPLDEFTEYIPCATVNITDEYVAIVYWKGGLLKYEFILVTIDAKAKTPTLISRKVIASTMADDKTIKKSVSSIDADMIIHIIAGQNEVNNEYTADISKTFSMEIQSTGDIMFSFVDEL